LRLKFEHQHLLSGYYKINFWQDYTKPWAMGAITVASVGAFTTVLCTVAIIAYWNTTIMRSDLIFP
jgi:hypothetical protein